MNETRIQNPDGRHRNDGRPAGRHLMYGHQEAARTLAVGDVLGRHFIMPFRTHWRCSCGAEFDVSDLAIDHQAAQVLMMARGLIDADQLLMFARWCFDRVGITSIPEDTVTRYLETIAREA